ncbi:MAG TPA: hypothetical protein VG293_03295 [Solirubrobacteraceae bacterium]|nr:hypothetical protein [Solirubrobacteraceae bacterium]
MVVQAPPLHTVITETEVDAGVIEEARRRQRLHRRIAGSVLALVAAGALLAGMATGGGGSGPGASGAARPSDGDHGPALADASLKTAFPGAPVTQRNGFGVESNTCPLARPNRYLPARAGCVFVARADMTGDDRRDLVIVYSVLSRRHPDWFSGPVPIRIAKDFVPLHAYLKVVFPGGATVSIRIKGMRGTDTAAIDLITGAGGGGGDEVFLDVSQISSGATDVAYGVYDGRLVPAGVLLASGGDGAASFRFGCTAGTPPGIVSRAFVLIGPTIYSWWRETKVVYAWRAGRLVRVASATRRVRGPVRNSARALRHGCAASTG